MHWYCSLHQLQLVEVAVTSVAAGPDQLLSSLYSISLLLQGTGKFERMKGVARRIATSELDFEPGPSFADAKEFAVEMCQYMLTHYKRFARSQDCRKHHWIEGSPDDDSDEDVCKALSLRRVVVYVRFWHVPLIFEFRHRSDT